MVEIDEKGRVLPLEVESDSFTIVLWSFDRGQLFYSKMRHQKCEGYEAVWQGSEQRITLMNNKQSVMLLPTTAPLAIVDVKEEYFVFEERDARGFEQSGTAKEAQNGLKWDMKYVCLVYNVLFQRLQETGEVMQVCTSANDSCNVRLLMKYASDCRAL